MKLSELSFKVITGTEERNRAIQEALFAKGGTWTAGVGRKFRELNADSLAHNAEAFGNKFPNLSHSCGLVHFTNELIAPEVTFQQALDLIAQVEMPDPEFPFKPKDWCIASDTGLQWKLGVFSHVVINTFHCVGSSYSMVAPFDEKPLGGNSKPAEWWEIKDGKPVLVKRGKTNE